MKVRCNCEKRPLPDRHELKVPVFDLDLTHDVQELLGKVVKVNAVESGTITTALQTVRFKLDERGAVLRSRGEVVVWMGKGDEPPNLVFDGPFLLMLRRKASQQPYLALWVDNAEILVGE